jgi:hypothetical protein
MSDGIRVRLIDGPFDGLEFVCPEGTITHRGTPLALPFSDGDDGDGLKYVVYHFGATPRVAYFHDFAGLTISPGENGNGTSDEY